MGWWMCYLVHGLYLYNFSVNCLDTSFVCHSAQRYLNSASYTEAGPLDLISDDETDDRLKLPGALKGVWAVVSSVQLKPFNQLYTCVYTVFAVVGEHSKRATKPEIHVKHLQFSPTGQCVGRCYDTQCGIAQGRLLIGATTNDLCTHSVISVCSIT